MPNITCILGCGLMSYNLCCRTAVEKIPVSFSGLLQLPQALEQNFEVAANLPARPCSRGRVWVLSEKIVVEFEEKSMKKVGIIRCQQTEDLCPGTMDFKCAAKGKLAFKELGGCEVIGFVSCGGCPGK